MIASRLGGAVFAAALLSAAVPLADGRAQSVDLGAAKSGLPIEIQADNGIEWQQQNAVVRARGNARAVRGDVTVNADVLSAYYREDADGNTEIWRLEADGDVTIVNPSGTAAAEKAVYDVATGVVVLGGNGTGAELAAENARITADQQIEYWEAKHLLVARKNAHARQEGKDLFADVLVAEFTPDKDGRLKIERVQAFDKVRIVTPEETVRASRGTYDVASGIATLTGAVKITRGANQLNGCRATVNLKTGISKLFACSGNSARASRVEGLIQPKDSNTK